ncbi:hypothetical protein [Streptomyces marincola]|uniref:Uncharacterized protein n=1 Tax=Streptomyces marincola TaxID=2878388 RepID=A0A1W7D4K6_9ACTN|nr:hypothetical protein [Streptomyces marincola]ARQ71956.1 hypothetical protein CAG99_26780 [Streptomyces marincola]
MSDRETLPVGATGKRQPTEPEFPGESVRRFKTACHSAGRAPGMRLLEIADPSTFASFGTARLALHGVELTALGHIALPWVAFAPSEKDVRMYPVFAPPPAWATHFAASGLRVLSLSFLGKPVSQFDLSELRLVETVLIDLNKPETVGDLLFNYWD